MKDLFENRKFEWIKKDEKGRLKLVMTKEEINVLTHEDKMALLHQMKLSGFVNNDSYFLYRYVNFFRETNMHPLYINYIANDSPQLFSLYVAVLETHNQELSLEIRRLLNKDVLKYVFTISTLMVNLKKNCDITEQLLVKMREFVQIVKG